MTLVVEYKYWVYTNSLVHADSFIVNFTNMTFQKEPRYIYVLNADSFTYTYIKYIHTYFSHYAKLALSENIRSV